MPYAVIKYTIRAVFLVALLSLAVACVSKRPEFQPLFPLPADNICRVTVLPFTNETEYIKGDTVFYRIFVAELVRSGNFVVAQEGDVRRIYKQLLLLPGEKPDVENLRYVAGQLGSQLVITGTIIEMAEKKGGSSGMNPSLAVELRILDPDTAGVLWTTYLKREGEDYRKVMHFGLVNTLTQLSRIVSQEIMELWFNVGGMKPCRES